MKLRYINVVTVHNFDPQAHCCHQLYGCVSQNHTHTKTVRRELKCLKTTGVPESFSVYTESSFLPARMWGKAKSNPA